MIHGFLPSDALWSQGCSEICALYGLTKKQLKKPFNRGKQPESECRQAVMMMMRENGHSATAITAYFGLQRGALYDATERIEKLIKELPDQYEDLREILTR